MPLLDRDDDDFVGTKDVFISEKYSELKARREELVRGILLHHQRNNGERLNCGELTHPALPTVLFIIERKRLESELNLKLATHHEFQAIHKRSLLTAR